ncbi:MAG: UDP-N-acetylmuramoyl-L-alanine--D-glutamate ligase [Elusimicrobiaceae bacterium]|nr:UDP-N-acetylmuramoyl-L-alanine--D-glutamate ligase [Elusimicrobiaceae bacterium]
MFNLANFPCKKATVLGGGKSGQAVAQLLAAHGCEVLISDENTVSLAVPSADITLETGGHTEQVFLADFIVKSPGIFPGSAVLLKARELAIPVFSELEVALSFVPPGVQILAVTGTNGKTTSTTLLGKILEKKFLRENLGHTVKVCGNIGNPISTCVDSVKNGDALVIEVSSYQLEDSTYFHPHIAGLLNITPDHLDHHSGMKNYIAAKACIFKDQTKQDIAVLNAADGVCAQLAEQIKSEIWAFSAQPKHWMKTDVFYDGDELIFSEGAHLRPPKLRGIHNIENAMAAALMALRAGATAQDVQAAFDDFHAMEHRIEPVAIVHGVSYINDSKATNLDSTITALKSFEKEKNIWLILGGRDKGASYEVLLPYLKDHCKCVLSIGECMDKIEKELRGAFPIVRCTTLEKAVAYGAQHAQQGDVVLLSPACASFDQFKSFEHRGEVFKQLVKKLV